MQLLELCCTKRHTDVVDIKPSLSILQYKQNKPLVSGAKNYNGFHKKN